MPTHYMTTFKEPHYTGFFESNSKLFGPVSADIHGRYVAYQAQEMKNPLKATLETAEQKRSRQRYIEGLKTINVLDDLDNQEREKERRRWQEREWQEREQERRERERGN